MSPHGLYQRQLGICQGRRPATTMSLHVGLERPVAVEIEGALKLRLVEADHLRPILPEDLVEPMLFLLGVDASNIVVHDGELVTVLQRLLDRSTILVPSLSDLRVSHISSSFVRGSIASRILRSVSSVLLLGIILRCGVIATALLLFFLRLPNLLLLCSCNM